MTTVENLIYPAASNEDGWHVVGLSTQLFAEKPCHGTHIENVRIGLFFVEGEVYALDDICTHGNALLTDGELEDFEIECPLHAGVFDIRSGKATGSPATRSARRHKTRIDDGWLSVKLNLGGAEDEC